MKTTQNSEFLAYSLSFSLEFASERLSKQFREFYRGNQAFFLEIYSVLLICFMVAAYFRAFCEETRESLLCAHQTLYIVSISSLFLTFLLHKRVKSPYFSRFLMVFGSFYTYLCVISLDFQAETCFLLVFLVVSAENFLISCSWKQHIAWISLTFALIWLYLWTFPCFLNKLRGLDQAILLEIAGFYAFVASLQEKLLKEVWSFVAVRADRTRDLEKLLAEVPTACCVVDENCYVVAINRVCSLVFEAIENGISTKNRENLNVRSFLHRNVEEFVSEGELQEFRRMLEDCRGERGRGSALCRAFRLENCQKRNAAGKEDKNMKKIMSDLSEIGFGFGEDSNNSEEITMYEIVVVEVKI